MKKMKKWIVGLVLVVLTGIIQVPTGFVLEKDTPFLGSYEVVYAAETGCQHEWSDWTVTEEADCEHYGERVRFCTACGEKDTEMLPPNDNHKWSSWTRTSSPTCTEPGEDSRYCTICYKNEYRDVKATGVHDWSEWYPHDEATCGESGTETRYCYNCYTEQTRTTPATGDHYWDEWYVSKKATIHAAGEKKRECYDCSAVQTKTISALKAYAKFSKKTYSVTVGKTLKLKVKYANGDKVKKWKVNKKSIAKISSKGKLKAKKAGTVKVTVTMKSGKKASCKVKVKAKKSSRSSSRSSGGDSDNDSGVVYWVPSGEVYHSSPNCRTLSRSRVIYHGSISESGKSRRCKVCG